MSRASRVLHGVAAATILTVIGASSAAAAGPDPASITFMLPASPITCRVETSVSVLLLDSSGATIAGATVTWSLMPVSSSQDAVVEPETTTGSQGVASTKVWIDCIPGPRTLNATAGDVTASASLRISAAEMPETATAPAPEPARGGQAQLASALIAAGALAGVALVGRRVSRARRRRSRRLAPGPCGSMPTTAPAAGLPL